MSDQIKGLGMATEPDERSTSTCDQDCTITECAECGEPVCFRCDDWVGDKSEDEVYHDGCCDKPKYSRDLIRTGLD